MARRPGPLFEGVPQVLGTDRHFTRGGVELEGVGWDPRSMMLSGTALGAPGCPWSLAVYMPPDYVWEGKGDAFFQMHDWAGVLASAQQVEPRIIRARLDFGASPRLSWSFRFRRP
jgi:hypothetical protein